MNEPDRKDLNKLYHCAEYATGIYTYLRERERVTAAKYGYMKNQPELNEKMRAVLMDWICAVSEKFTLLQETTFLTANLIDRFLECEKITKGKLQLVGVAALVIASKYEEIYPPDIKDFIHVTEKTVSKDEILKMESQILNKLKYELSGPSILRFIERYSKLVSTPPDQLFNLALYFGELQLIDYNLLKHPPSLVAAGSVYLAQRILKGSSTWPEIVKSQSGHNEEEVKQCAKDILSMLQAQDKAGFQATKKKFSQKKYMEVAKSKIDYSMSI